MQYSSIIGIGYLSGTCYCDFIYHSNPPKPPTPLLCLDQNNWTRKRIRTRLNDPTPAFLQSIFQSHFFGHGVTIWPHINQVSAIFEWTTILLYKN